MNHLVFDNSFSTEWSYYEGRSRHSITSPLSLFWLLAKSYNEQSVNSVKISIDSE